MTRSKTPSLPASAPTGSAPESAAGDEAKGGEPALHVILGAGQIGARLRRLLLERGHRVRVVARRAPAAAAEAHPRLSRATGDMTDLAFAEEATRGAAVVYDCMNPQYHQWKGALLPLGKGGVHGATAAGARLVALDCLYALGAPAEPMRHDSPHAPRSKKGELRVALERLRTDAAARGDLQLAIGRASDFFGPDLPYSGWSERFFTHLYAGKAGECLGDPDMPHAYTFADDVAAALRTLGEDPRGAGHHGHDGFSCLWHLPTAPAESTRQLAARLGRLLGLEARVKRVPRWLLQTAGLFSPFMRELAEMTYQWDAPFLVDDSRFVSTFGQAATPLAESAAATAVWAAERFGAAPAHEALRQRAARR
jgi:nucleoside-diphosphate-sugar epimerase